MITVFHKSIAITTVFAVVMNSVPSLSAGSEFGVYADILARNRIIDTKELESEYRLGDPVARGEVAKVTVKLSGFPV